VLASRVVGSGRRARIAPRGAVAIALAVAALPLFSQGAAGQSTLDRLEARMDAIQERLDATTMRIEELRTEADEARARIEAIDARTVVLNKRRAELVRRAAERADVLYRSGGTGALEVLLAADSFSELTDRARMLSEVSKEDARVFVALTASERELSALARALERRTEQLARARAELAEESRRLQEQFDAVAEQYEELKARLARLRAQRAESAAPAAPAASAPAPGGARVVPTTGGMACPVAGPVSFVDSWGAPRDGHTHQGVDLMAAPGTPVVAIVSGTITYAAYNDSGGNMIFLTGDDGNAYWYMHNQTNLVTGGHVDVGQQIATVGDTGNAAGTPHLHFEYHPGGGAAVNPYPLVASIC
jgi:murein DD-endopeptidase MepM/ murein hydrolase activator NlpD